MIPNLFPHHPGTDLDRTRTTLIQRLKERGDDNAWQVFFDRYWKLMYQQALVSGLCPTEAEDVAFYAVAEVPLRIQQYDRNQAHFRTWLLNLLQRHITEAMNRRPKDARGAGSKAPNSEQAETAPGAMTLSELETHWNQEYDRQLLAAARERVKLKVPPRSFQIFELSVEQKWPAARTARFLKTNWVRIYLDKSRVNRLIRRELSRMRHKQD